MKHPGEPTAFRWELYSASAIKYVFRRYWWVLVLAVVGSVTLSLISIKLSPRVYVAEVWLKPNENMLSQVQLLEKASQLSRESQLNSTSRAIQPLLERSIAIKLSGNKAQRVMKSVIENIEPDVYSIYGRSLARFGGSAEQGLEAWIAKYLRVERRGKEQFYRIRWHFFDREAVALQLTKFYERLIAIENRSLSQEQANQLVAVRQYVREQLRAEKTKQEIANILTSYLKTLTSMTDANYLSILEPLNKVEVRHSAVYPERLPLLILSAFPFLILGILIMKLLCHKEDKRV